MKFRRGLIGLFRSRDSRAGTGETEDDDPEGWYSAARMFNATRLQIRPLWHPARNGTSLNVLTNLSDSGGLCFVPALDANANSCTS